MAMNFNRPAPTAAATAPAAAPVSDVDSLEVKSYDIMADKAATQSRLAHSPEVEALTATIDVNDMNSIISFGNDSATEISKASDIVLRSMNMAQLDETSKMLVALGKVMDQFNIDELREAPQSFFSKIFGDLRKQLDKILAKYNTMGDEVDKIYVELKRYEAEIKQSNRNLEVMFQANVGYFHDLEKYIVAAEQACGEISDYIAQLKLQLDTTGDQSLTFEIQSMQQALEMMEQRAMDLRTAENVALQSIPMIKTIQFSNVNLIRKINSAFIITLPVFKQALAQAIMLKRQKIQADAISALDQRTNEMLIKNARNTVAQAQMTTRMAAGSSIKAETLEQTWRTIMSGIEETQKIQETARTQRVQDTARLEAIKKEFMTKYNVPK